MIILAKHGEKKIFFNFNDLKFASFFLDFIKKKKFYAQVLGSINHKNQLEFKIRGTPEEVKIALQKIMKLYHKSAEIYDESKDLQELEKLNDMDSEEDKKQKF